MGKSFSLIVALLLSITVHAQVKIDGKEMAAVAISPELCVLTPSDKTNNAPQRKITVNEGETLVGFYTTDALPTFGSDGYLGFGSSPCIYSVANLFGEEVTANYIGGQIVRFRFAVACDVEVNSAFIYDVDSNGNVSSTPASIVYINSTLSTGWNDVELDEPVTIDVGHEYLIGYEYVQVVGAYPIATDYALARDIQCNYFYDSTNNIDWSKQSGYGALCLQAVVAGGSPIDYDVALNDLSIRRFVAQDTDAAYSFTIRKYGDNTPESYTLKVAVDGEEVETLDSPVNLSSRYQTISRTINTSDLSVGNHTLSVVVDKINGSTPTVATDNDVVEKTFAVYADDGNMPARQLHLVENLTSIYCGYCPLGHGVLQSLQTNYPNKYAWVAVHSIGMGNDTLAISNTYLTVERFLGVNGISYPSAAISRAALTSNDLGISGEYMVPIGYSSSYASRVAKDLNNAIEDAYDGIPAFVSVNIAPDYDATTRELTITVSGEGYEAAASLLADNRLTVYLTEDGIAGQQEDYMSGSARNGYLVDYTHDNVLRAIVSEYEWGDDINWTSSSTYENTLTITLADKWNADNMHIIAFISGAMKVLKDGAWVDGDLDSAMVNNAESVDFDGTAMGITTVPLATDGATTKTYYSLDGRRLNAPQKGVNIVRSSDGTTKKIVVK